MARKKDFVGGGGGDSESEKIDLCCPWNDHGHICGVKGWMSLATNGKGPWYCSKHFWQLKGEPEKVATDTEPLTYREQWYRERKLDYEPPKIVDCPPFKAVGYMPTAPKRGG